MSTNKNITAFKKHITLLAVICTLIIPLINNFGLSLILSMISGDIMYTAIADILNYFVIALDSVNLFLVYAVLINSLIRFGLGKSTSTIVLCVLRIFIVYASYLAIGAIVTTNFSDTLTSNLSYCGINALIDIMLLAGAVILIVFLRSKYIDEKKTNITVKGFFDLKNPIISVILWVTVLISAFLLSGCIINTVTDITTYGADNLNSTEIIYLVSPYIKWLCKTVLGYAIMVSCAKWLDFQWKCIHKAGNGK